MKRLRLAFAVPSKMEERLAIDAIRQGHVVALRCRSAGELVSMLPGFEVDAALVSCDPRYVDSGALSATDATGVRVVGLVASDGERRHAASIGLLDTVDSAMPWEELEPIVAGRPRPAVDIDPPRRGRVIAVWGPAGSPGRTTMAIGIAAELAAAGHSVALADADTHGASIAPALGLLDESPGFAAACRLAGAKGLSIAELERIGQRYLSGHGSFWVLTGIGRASRWPELSADRVTTTLRECREWVDFTVVDTGSSLEHDEEISSDLFAPRRNAATIAALHEADDVVAVGSADPVGLSRFLRAHVDLVDTVEAERIRVVVNKVRASAVGLAPEAQVEQTLRRFGGISEPALVAWDGPAHDSAILAGRTLRDEATRSAARVALGRFVQRAFLPDEPEPVVPRRVRRRRSGRLRWSGVDAQ